VAKRGSEGWANYGAIPLTIGESALLLLHLGAIGFSADLTKVYFKTSDEYLPEAPPGAPLLYDISSGSLTWLSPPPASGSVVGFSADMSTFYSEGEGVAGCTSSIPTPGR
jgi:hypothetical protein